MKTKLIEELRDYPVKFTGKRIAIRSPVLTTDDRSFLETLGHGEVEEYRFEARIGARFMRDPTVPEAHREHLYKNMMRSVTEHIYGDIRGKMFEMMPYLQDIAATGDRELYDKVHNIVEDVLEMTIP